MGPWVSRMIQDDNTLNYILTRLLATFAFWQGGALAAATLVVNFYACGLSMVVGDLLLAFISTGEYYMLLPLDPENPSTNGIHGTLAKWVLSFFFKHFGINLLLNHGFL